MKTEGITNLVAQDVIDLLTDLRKRVGEDFNIYLSGGYCRDVLCGLTPKDVDVVLTPKKDRPLEMYYIPSRYYVNYNTLAGDVTDKSDMIERGVYQVVGLFNSKLSTPEVQFIVYSKPMTQEEVAFDFDMGINQIVWDGISDVPTYTEAFLEGHKGKYIECMHDYCKVRTYRRFERMKDKFPEYEIINMPSITVLPVEEVRQRVAGTYTRPITGSFIGEDCND